MKYFLLILITVFNVACTSNNNSNQRVDPEESERLVDISHFNGYTAWDRMFKDVEEYSSPKFYKQPSHEPFSKSRHRVGNYYFITANFSGTPKYISSEVATNWQYWMTNEVSRLFKERYLDTGKTPLLPTNNGTTKYPLILEPYIHSKYDNIEKFMRSTEPNIKKWRIKDAQKECTFLVGHSNISWKSETEKDHFYKECYYIIVTKFSTTEKQKIAGNLLLKRLNNPYYYNESTIKQHIVYQDKKYDAKLVDHYLGKYSKHMREKLRFVKRNRVFVKFSPLVSDDSFFKLEYFNRALSNIGFNSYMLKSLFNIRGTERFYDDYRAHKLTLNRRSLEPFGIDSYNRHLIRNLNASCKINSSYNHVAIENSATRIVLNCKNDAIVMSQTDFENKKQNGEFEEYEHYNHYVGTFKRLNASKSFNLKGSEKEMFSRSKVTYLNMDEAAIQKNTGTFGYGTFLMFDFESDGFVSLTKDENFPWEQQTGQALNISVQALSLIKRFPPNTMVSWVANSSDNASFKNRKNKSNYVFHHGILWEFPFSDFDNIH